jgi:hypothetical protein
MTMTMIGYVLLNFLAGCHWAWQIHSRLPYAVGVTTIRNQPSYSFKPRHTKLHYKDIPNDDIYYPRTISSTKRSRRLVRRKPRIIPSLRQNRYQKRQYYLTRQSGKIFNKESFIGRPSNNNAALPNFTSRRRIGLISKKRSMYYYDRSWDDFDERHLVPNDSSASFQGDINNNYVPIPDAYSLYNDVLLLKKGGNKLSKPKPTKVASSTPINEWLPSMTIGIMIFYMGILTLVA